jgi:type II secretory pathway component HofQ
MIQNEETNSLFVTEVPEDLAQIKNKKERS